jgi:hypothetical protein
MVEAFEPNAHRACPRSDSDKANAFDDSVTGFGHHGESHRNVRTLTRFCSRARLADGNGPFGEHSITIFGDPPSDLVDGSDARNNLATEQSQFFDGSGRIGQFRSWGGLGIKKLDRLRTVLSRLVGGRNS